MQTLPGRRREVGRQDEGLKFRLRATHPPCIVMEFEPEVLLIPKQTVGGVALEVIPDLFGWIEFGRIAGEWFNVESGIVPLQSGDERSFVDGSIVPQQDDWTRQVS